MQIAILGPLEVCDHEGRPVEIAGTRLRTLLLRLALEPGRPVSTSALVDAVWGRQPPAEATNALQTLVSRLRRALGGTDAIVQSAGGYRLSAQPQDVDVHRFERLAAEGSAALRNAEAARALIELDTALALWRGPALVDAGGDALEAAATRLGDLRVTALADRAEAELLGGRHPDVAGLDTLVAEHPLNERLTGLLMRALGSAGRQADALNVYERLRVRLADELGVDPARELAQIHVTLLRGEMEPATVPRRRTNLKSQLTTFVGRDTDVARIAALLDQHRLVTLVGPGGAGKTRLATEAVARLVDGATDGIWLSELATVTDGADVAQAVLSSVGQRELHLPERANQPTGRDAVGRLIDALADRRTILVLDNCEHVIEASARLAEQLLGGCAELRVLATSREPLGITGESLLAVPPLGQPDPAAGAAEALGYPAVRLFADRAAAAQPEFVVDESTVADVIEIVRRLDGLPLAIELAAARLRTIPLEDVASRLSDRFRLLTGGSRTALPRHRTLRAVVEWSWDLLSPDERLFAEELSVFPSGVTLASATAVRPEKVDAADVGDLLGSLVDKSLLQPIGDRRRMRMLETIREYGTERLAERGDLGAARERHATHFAAVLAEAGPHLTTAGQLPWLELLTAERENMLAAMRFRCDVGAADDARRIAVALAWWVMLLGERIEVRSWMADVLAVPGGTDANLELLCRSLSALAATAQTDPDSSEDIIADLVALTDELALVDVSDHPALGLIRPLIAFFSGNRDLMRQFAAEAIEYNDDWSRAAVRTFLAGMAENDGDVEGMRRETEVALGEFRRLGERWGTANALRSLAALYTLEGDLDRAVDANIEALRLQAELHSNDDDVFMFSRLADLELRRGDAAAARGYARQAHEHADADGPGIESVLTLTLLGDVEFRLGHEDVGRARLAEAHRRLGALPREHPMLGHIRSIVYSTAGRIALTDGDLATAHGHVAAAYPAALATRDRPLLAAVGVVIAQLASADGHLERAAELLGAAAALRGADDWTALDVSQLAKHLRDGLGVDAFDAAYGGSRALTHDEAIARLDPVG